MKKILHWMPIIIFTIIILQSCSDHLFKKSNSMIRFTMEEKSLLKRQIKDIYDGIFKLKEFRFSPLVADNNNYGLLYGRPPALVHVSGIVIIRSEEKISIIYDYNKEETFSQIKSTHNNFNLNDELKNRILEHQKQRLIK